MEVLAEGVLLALGLGLAEMVGFLGLGLALAGVVYPVQRLYRTGRRWWQRSRMSCRTIPRSRI